MFAESIKAKLTQSLLIKVTGAKMKTTRKLKKIFSLMTLAVFLLAFAGIVFADSQYTGAGILIRMTRFEPSPVEPGSYAKVWLKVENVGDADINDFKFNLNPEFPFSLDDNEKSLRDLGKMGPGEQATIVYKIRVSENAVEGDNPLKFEYTEFGKWMEAELTVPVRTLDAIISVEDVKTSPESVEPGQSTKVTLTIKNNADSDMRQINLALGLIKTVTTNVGTSFVELPFTPKTKSNEQTIYSLSAGEERDVVFDMIVDPDAESKPYKIPLHLTYYDSTGKNYTRSYIIGIVVGGKPDLDVIIESTTIKKMKSPGIISLKIVNKGTTDAKFMNINLKDNENYKVVSSNEAYIGSVDSDDFETADFTLVALKKVDGVIKIPVSLEYKDANNNDYTDTANIELNLEKSKIMNADGRRGGVLFFAIVIIVIGYFVYRRWSKKKKEKGKK